MTITEAKQKLVNWALAQVGYTEGADNYNKYAPLWTAAGGWNAQNQPWCDVFVDVCFIEAFGLDLAAKLTYQPKGGFSALCSQSAQYYKNNGAYFYSPEVGDQIFFNSGGGINHTGIVTQVSGGVVYTVEGNSSDMVARRQYATGSSYINGYGRPNWGIFSSSSTEPVTGGENTTVNQPSSSKPVAAPAVETCTFSVTMPVIKYGDKDDGKDGPVHIMQRRLIAHGCSCGWWGADGDYGNGTKGALLKFQQENKLEQDGVCGKLTWTALFK